jgi:Protein of unknown function (DUF3352)
VPASTVTTRAAGPGGWSLVVIGVVAALAVAIGATLGAFLLNGRSNDIAAASARYVPADAPIYLEWHLEPSTTQDAALRELLGRFPAIEGIDLTQPLYPQLTGKIDEAIASHVAVRSGDVSWAEDVEPWFTGTVAFAMTSYPPELLDPTFDPTGEPMPETMPEMVVVFGSEDADAARAAIARLLGDAEVIESTHAGTTVYESGADVDGAWAITDDAVVVAPNAEGVRAALDLAAGGSGSVDGVATAELLASLPADRLGFMLFDFGPILEASLEAAEAEDPATAAAMRAMFEGQPTRGAAAIAASGDRLIFDSVAEAPTGELETENADRGLADHVPADALYYADGGNLGVALANFVTAMKASVPADDGTGGGVATAEAALGAELEELVRWIGDGAMVAGWDGTSPYAGLVLEPIDRDAAERRLDQLLSFARLAATDPSSGLSVDEGDVAGVRVTTLRWADPNAGAPDPMMPMPVPELAVTVQYAMTDEHVLIGIGDGFVARSLGLEPADALAAIPRFSETIAELGGTENAGMAWWDVTGTRVAVEGALQPMLPFIDPDGMYEATVQPWLVPFDRLALVARLEGDLVIQRGALFVE